MTLSDLLDQLRDRAIELAVDGDELVVRSRKSVLDPALLGRLREHKPALLELLRAKSQAGGSELAQALLVELDPGEHERVVAGVAGGASNLQAVYPLAPLQEGILFHHLLATNGDPYLLPVLLGFDTRERLDAYVRALEAVIERHEILRTAVMWEGLREPVQVVWRAAPLAVEQSALSPADGDVAQQLYQRFDPRHYRIDVRRAPLIRVHVAADFANARWVLLMLVHHIISDHTTLDVLRAEVQAHMRGEGHLLPPALPFREFVAQARRGARREEHEAFFRGMLADVDEPTAPFGLLDVQGDGSGIAESEFDLDAGLASRLRARARSLGVSVASVCHVAWAQVLARVSGRSDVVFGTLLFGRMQGGAGIGRVVGPFINTLPIRIHVGDEGVEAGVRRVHALLAELLHHEHASLALAQRCSGVQAPAPLFSALLNYRHSAGPSAGAAWEGIEAIYAQERSNYPLTMSVDDLGEGLRLTAKVPASVGPRRVCALMDTALERLVTALEMAPHTALRRVDVLPATESRQVLEEWNATRAEFPGERCVHELFEAQVERSPEATAVVCGEESLSYAELNARANRLAHHLRERGVVPDARVAICVERGLDMLVGLFAILKAGGAYVPLDPAYPVERLRHMLEDSAPVALLTQAALGGLFAKVDVPLLDLGAPRPEWARAPSTNPDPQALALTSRHLAYVIYTSGSTGRPKGVMNQHRCLVNRLAWCRAAWGLTAHDVLLGQTSLSFDGSVRELLLPLTVGGRVAMARPDGHRDPDDLVQTMRREGVTTLNLVPSLLRVLLEHADIAACTALSRVLCGGEALPAALLRRFHEQLPGVTLHNLYGPSEAATALSALDCTANRADTGVPIGRPIANTRVYVLDAAGASAPVGVAGELYIGGAGVARGYLNRPELTAERFVPDPFSRDRGARLYRTGDLVRWLASGNLDFLGRNDFQVKVRGYRVELGEIEARLLAHPHVREAVVVAREATAAGARLVAYCAGPQAVEAEALRTHVLARLPEYMAPAAYVWLEALPLTPNGKVDRKALPAPDADAYARRAYDPPAGETEEALARIWSDVLGLERVGRFDNFFELGGHSLLALQVLSRVRQALAADVALGELFARPVLAELARGIEAGSRAALPPIAIAGEDERRALSFAQQRLWFLEQLGGAGRVYHIAKSVRLRGELDRAALRRALDRIVARHEALRTTFVAVDGEPAQRVAVAEQSRFELAEHDLAGVAESQPEFARLMAEEEQTPFDLARGPLIRGRVIRLAADDHVLLVTMHHIVSDGWSMGVLIRELNVLYGAFARGAADPLPALEVQYADYAAWQRRFVSGEVLQRQAEYWRRTLVGAPQRLELPVDRARPAQHDHAGEFAEFELDERLTAALKALGRRHGATLFMTLLSGWAVLLSRLSGQSQVVIGTPTANRGRREIEGLIGFFVNTLALRLDLSGAPSVAELLAEVKARVLAAQHNQDIPFEQVVELVQPARSLGHSPLFQVLLAWQNAPRGELELPGLRLEPVDAGPRVAAKFELSLNLHEAHGRVVGGLTYATALFERATAERHLDCYRTVLRAMAADERHAVDRLPWLPEAQRRLVVEEWNATTAHESDAAYIHELFEAQVARDPAAPAVAYEGRGLSYGELNARANRLAHHLRQRGVGPDARVAICVERGLEMVVGLLAVLKAGGAYVPLDPGYPRDRLRYMLEDSAPVALLTQAPLLPLFAGLDVPALDLSAAAPVWAACDDTDPDPAALGLTPQHLAYVIYTSGSTGRPKGVMNTHRAAVNLLAWSQAAWRMQAHEALLQRMSFSFDVSVRELFWPLMAGARLVLAHPEGSKDPARLVDTIRREGITTVHFVPAILQAFLDHPDVQACAGLRRVLCGGEPLAPALVRRFRERLPDSALHHMYGPTETTVAVTARCCTQGGIDGGAPLGRPVANTRIYVLDGAGEPVPVGVAGELHVGGVQVARGYLGRPALTAERFTPDPFSRRPGARLYRTGDLGRWLADGRLEFLGRDDQQVKVRGFRIELEEIAARLGEHPGVREALVLARDAPAGDKRLVAYYVGASGQEPAVEALRAHLAERLPDYMVPAAYVRMEALPLTPNGKVDRDALPEPEGAAYVTREYVAPEGETEQALAAIWAELLGRERIGRHDDFFELGGHSLLATKLVLRVQREMDVDLAVRDVFERPVLRVLAEHLLGEQLARFDPQDLERLEQEMQESPPGKRA